MTTFYIDVVLTTDPDGDVSDPARTSVVELNLPEEDVPDALAKPLHTSEPTDAEVDAVLSLVTLGADSFIGEITVATSDDVPLGRAIGVDHAHVLLDALAALQADISRGRKVWTEYEGDEDDPKITRDGFLRLMQEAQDALGQHIGNR